MFGLVLVDGSRSELFTDSPNNLVSNSCKRVVGENTPIE